MRASVSQAVSPPQGGEESTTVGVCRGGRECAHAIVIEGQVVTDYILSSVTAMVPTARLRLKAAESWG